jgi:hypothetical protein
MIEELGSHPQLGQRGFLMSEESRPALGAHRSTAPSTPGGTWQGVKLTTPLHLTVELMKVWKYTFSPSTCFHVVVFSSAQEQNYRLNKLRSEASVINDDDGDDGDDD